MNSGRLNESIITALKALAEVSESKQETHMVQNYKKAIASVQKYPLDIITVSECTALNGIGPTIVEKLENILNPLAKKTKIVKAPVKKASKRKEMSDSEEDGTGEKLKAVKRKKGKRKYTPKYRSAAWALLVGLYRATKGTSSLDKATLIDVAGPLSEVKLTSAWVNGMFENRSGWDSIKTLIKNEMIAQTTQGRRHIFTLTAEGIAAGKALDDAELKMNDQMNGGSQVSQNSQSEEEIVRPTSISVPYINNTYTQQPHVVSQEEVSRDSSSIHDIISDDDIEIVEESTTRKIDTFTVNFIDDYGSPCEKKDDAECSLEHDDLCFLIRINLKQFSCKIVSPFVEKNRQLIGHDESILGWIPDSDCPDFSKDLPSCLKIICETKTKPPPKLVERPPRPPILQTSFPFTPSLSQPLSQPLSQSQGSQSQTYRVSTPSQSQDENSQTDLEALFYNDRSKQEMQLNPNEPFEIILLLDIREKISKSDRTWFYENLLKAGIKVEQRVNEVGDFLWIARYQSGLEIVLDYIIERKCVDDLVSSHLSERFEEQKHRIKRTKLKFPFYLVEGDLTKTSRKPGQDRTLRNALCSVQKDGFFLKQTKSKDASIMFIKILNTEIINLAKGGINNVCTYKESLIDFNYFSAKRYLTNSEIFGRQLSGIFGISGAKAEVIVKAYPSPLALLNAFRQTDDTLLKDLKLDGRNIGNIVSKKLYLLFNSRDYTMDQE